MFKKLLFYNNVFYNNVYYIQGAWGDENIFAVLYVSHCYGPYTLL